MTAKKAKNNNGLFLPLLALEESALISILQDIFLLTLWKWSPFDHNVQERGSRSLTGGTAMFKGLKTSVIDNITLAMQY